METGRPIVLSSAMGGNIETSDFLRPICKDLGITFLTMSEWAKHDIRWNKKTWLAELEKADIVVCTSRHQIQPAKSANRAVQAMALGRCVLASPLPAYKEAIRHGETGFICDGPEEWRSTLAMLKDSPEVMRRVGKAAAGAVEPYSIKTVGDTWASLIKEQARWNCNPPKVDIVIPTYNNLDYLKACIESIRRSTDWPHNIIVVSSGDKDGTSDWLKDQGDVIRFISPERMHFSKANNAGLALAKEKYVCLLNDDTIVGKGWLTAMMHEAMKPGVGAVGPFSNCDLNWMHDQTVMVDNIQLVPGMRLEDLRPHLNAIQDYTHPKSVHDRRWVAFYATLLPRAVVDQIGGLDENFLSGDEDMDYCKRLREAGFKIVQTMDSWVFHFGGKTRKKVDETDHDRHQREDAENHSYFMRKWGIPPGDPRFRNEMVRLAPKAAAVPAPPPPTAALIPKDDRPLFGIYTGQAWERWTPSNVDQGGIGGSETATVFTARAFAKKGWRSVVFGDCAGAEKAYDGVYYIDYKRFDQFIQGEHFKFFVSSRRPDIFEKPIRADKKACVVHDIFLSPDRAANLWPDRVDRYFVLSPWHREFFLGYHAGIDPAKVVVSRDGVDLARFAEPLEREPGRMVYSSSPDRGLDVLLDCLPAIRKAIPTAQVHVFYGFDNWEKAVASRGQKWEMEWMEKIKKRLDDPGVVYRGRVGQTRLAKEMLRSQLWAYPTYFTETFCMTAAEQMAAGNPVVTTNLAALGTTVGDAGVLLDPAVLGESRTKPYQDKFVEEVVLMLTDKDRWKHYSEKSLAKAKGYSWDSIADEWLGLVGLPV